jgi:hypothetical protein
MNTELNQVLESLIFGAPQRHGTLTVFPLVAPKVEPPGYLHLGDALARNLVKVTEVSEGGSVPELLLENLADEDVLLLDGDELVGARQNRVLNTTILVPPHTRTKIPVSCVERGRWAYRSREFRSEDRMMFARARAAKLSQVSRSLRTSGKHRSDQGEVWDHVSSKAFALRAEAPSEAMSDVYAKVEVDLASYRDAFRAVPQQVGAIFAIGGRAVGLELFDAPETLAATLRKLVGSYAMDAIEHPAHAAASAPDAAAKELLRRASQLHAERAPGACKGTELRLEGPGLAGSALLDGSHVVHLSVLEQAAAP